MRLSDIREARYYNVNAADWAQDAVDREHVVYHTKAQKSWPQVLKIVGVQTYKFDYNKAMTDLTDRFGEPEHYPEDVHAWFVDPTDADTRDPDYFKLEVVLDYDGTVTIGDVFDE